MIRDALCLFVKMISGLQVRWVGCSPEPTQRIYFANHTSHLDVLIIWAALPVALRDTLRPAAAKDYWTKGRIRRWVAEKVIRAILIERHAVSRDDNPLQAMTEALDQGASIILFPEGFRNQAEGLQPFKAGLYHLHKKRPQVELIPVYLENLNRILPKGECLAVPILGAVSFGAPLAVPADDKELFLQRARQSIEELKNDHAA